MTWTIILPFPKIPDGLSLNSRAHWRVKNRSTRDVRILVAHEAIRLGIPVMQRLQVELVWVVKDRRKRDVDNAVGMLKVIADALASDRGISAHLVADDSPEFCVKLMPRIERRPGATPHFEVHITDITHRPDTVDDITREREI